MNSDFFSEIHFWFDDILKNIEVLTDELYTKFKRIPILRHKSQNIKIVVFKSMIEDIPKKS